MTVAQAELVPSEAEKTAEEVPAMVGAKVTSIWQEPAGGRAAEQVVLKVNWVAPPALDVLSFLMTENGPVVALLLRLTTVNRIGPTGAPTAVVPKSSHGGVMSSFGGLVPR